MSDIEQRLAAAAEALHEHDLIAQRSANVEDRLNGVAEEVRSLKSRHAREQAEVERLESLSLTRIIAALRGTRDDALAREQAEADAAGYRLAEAQARLKALHDEHEAALARLNQLTAAPQEYSELLDEKEQHVRKSGGPHAARLLGMAEERGRLTAELHEIAEAIQAARAALASLNHVVERLGSAASWSTYDTFFGGGVIASSVKHSRLDEVAQAAAHADRKLAILRTELADVDEVTAPQLSISKGTRFVDVWFDNIFTDLAVRDQIKQAQANAAHCVAAVGEVNRRLAQRDKQARGQLAEIETTRRKLLG